MKLYTKAFTLIDILISVAIVSLLSSVVLFNVTEGRNKADDAHMRVESSQVATAIELYKLDNGSRTPISVRTISGDPIPQAILGEMYQENSPQYNAAMTELVSGGYISEIPRSPSGDAYAYGEGLDGTSAVFVAKLKSSSSAQSNSKNSCPGIAPIQNLPTNCKFVHSSESLINFEYNSCSQYLLNNPDKICVKFPGAPTFCDMYGCGTGPNEYGFPENYPRETYFLSGWYATICDAPSTESGLCNGSNPDDYCTCI